VEKTKVTYSIDTNIKNDYDKKTKEKALNKSALIELLIKEWLDKNK
jgi:hypothetical protein